MIQFYFYSSISYHFTMQELPKFSCVWKYATSVHSDLLFPTREIPIHASIDGIVFQVPIQLCPLRCIPAPPESKFTSQPLVSLCSHLSQKLPQDLCFAWFWSFCPESTMCCHFLLHIQIFESIFCAMFGPLSFILNVYWVNEPNWAYLLLNALRLHVFTWFEFRSHKTYQSLAPFFFLFWDPEQVF